MCGVFYVRRFCSSGSNEAQNDADDFAEKATWRGGDLRRHNIIIESRDE